MRRESGSGAHMPSRATSAPCVHGLPALAQVSELNAGAAASKCSTSSRASGA
jgi:hypothetical protein